MSPEAKARNEGNTQPDIRHWITTVLADVTFVGDACSSFEVDNPVYLVDKASALLQIVNEACESLGPQHERRKDGILDRNERRRSSKAVQTSMERRQEGTLHFHEDG